MLVQNQASNSTEQPLRYCSEPFSTSGRTLNPVRSSLSDESIEALVCGQDWLRISVIGIIFSIIATYIFGILLWYPFINYVILLYCMWQKIVGILVIHYDPLMKRHQLMVYVMVRLELILMVSVMVGIWVVTCLLVVGL
jgi:hypothetical protein